MNIIPSLNKAILFAILSGVAFLVSEQATKLPLWARGFAVFLGVVFASGAVVEGVNWLAWAWAERAYQLKRLSQMSQASEVISMMRGLTPSAQSELAMLFGNLGIRYTALLGNNGPIFSLPLDGHRIDYGFIEEFLDLGDDRFLCPVSHWPDKTQSRMWAEALTRQLIRRGLALSAAGPYPARWVWVGQGKRNHSRRSDAYDLFFGKETTK